MEVDSLSQNGIQKVLNNAPAIVQLIDCQVKQREEGKFIIGQLSDGFSRIKKCVIMLEANKMLSKYDIIRTQLVVANIKNNKPAHIIVQSYKLLRNDVDQMIGQPIHYSEFQKTKQNPKGDNLIPPKQAKNAKKQEKKSINFDSFFQDQDQNKEKQNKKEDFKKVENKKLLNKKQSEAQNTQSMTHSIKPNNQIRQFQNKPPQNQNKFNNQKNIKQQQLNQPANKSPAINKQNLNSKQINSPRHQRQYTMIKQLYEGMQDWKLKVRVIFTSPVKTYIKKTNGQESQVFAFQACDRFDTIEFTAFGDAAGNFGNVIDNDNTYEIYGGKVSKDDQKGKFKIMINEKTTVNLLQDDITLPTVDQFCITPQKLLEKQIQTQWNIIALVKDKNQILQFVSRNGKNCKKKDILLCDPEAQVQVPLTLWFQKAQIKFQKIPYAFQGIVVSSYNDKKQFATSMKFNFRECKNHKFRKFVSSLDKMKLQNPVQDFSSRNKTDYRLVNFYQLRMAAQKLQNGNSLLMEKICFLTSISVTNKNFYLSCPLCKRKVFEEQNSACQSDKCGKAYDKAKYRYLLNVSLSDESESIWATAYDQAAEVILTSDLDGSIITADQFAKMEQEQIKGKIAQYLDREIKVVVMAKKESYNGQEKIKYSINKAVLHIEYEKELEGVFKRFEYLKGQLEKAE